MDNSSKHITIVTDLSQHREKLAQRLHVMLEWKQ